MACVDAPPVQKVRTPGGRLVRLDGMVLPMETARHEMRGLRESHTPWIGVVECNRVACGRTYANKIEQNPLALSYPVRSSPLN